MLRLTVIGDEFYDEATEEFHTVGDVILELEHSLIALSKWESKFEKPFLATTNRTNEETLGYIEAMILNQDYPKDVLDRLTSKNFDEINEYVGSTQSATTFSNLHTSKRTTRSEIITAELIYYWMVTFNIPFECESWHLNRLFALIQICNIKNSKQKKMPRNELAARNRALNEQRKAQLGTRG